MTSNEENSVVKNECDPGFSLEPQLPKQEGTANWAGNCQQETKPLNPKAVEFAHSWARFQPRRFC